MCVPIFFQKVCSGLSYQISEEVPWNSTIFVKGFQCVEVWTVVFEVFQCSKCLLRVYKGFWPHQYRVLVWTDFCIIENGFGIHVLIVLLHIKWLYVNCVDKSLFLFLKIKFS